MAELSRLLVRRLKGIGEILLNSWRLHTPQTPEKFVEDFWSGIAVFEDYLTANYGTSQDIIQHCDAVQVRHQDI